MAAILGFISMFKTGRMESGGPSNICFSRTPPTPSPSSLSDWPDLCHMATSCCKGGWEGKDFSLLFFFSLDNGSRQKGRKWKCILVWPANGICRRTPISPPFHVVLEQLSDKVPSPSTTFSSKKGALVLNEPGMRDGWP